MLHWYKKINAVLLSYDNKVVNKNEVENTEEDPAIIKFTSWYDAREI